ncbi:MAG: hypothetical protein M3548_14975 [Actinomycetota bacterium]|nr:hypothetical protein [Actinomycetota bacterium]
MFCHKPFSRLRADAGITKIDPPLESATETLIRLRSLIVALVGGLLGAAALSHVPGSASPFAVDVNYALGTRSAPTPPA